MPIGGSWSTASIPGSPRGAGNGKNSAVGWAWPAAIFSVCKLVIGVRLHSLIMASAVGTPIVGIDYAPKVRGFIESIDWTEHCCHLRDLRIEKLQDLIDGILKRLGQ